MAETTATTASTATVPAPSLSSAGVGPGVVAAGAGVGVRSSAVGFGVADLSDESEEHLDGGSLSEALSIATLPTFVLLNQEGREVARAVGAAHKRPARRLVSMLKEALLGDAKAKDVRAPEAADAPGLSSAGEPWANVVAFPGEALPAAGPPWPAVLLYHGSFNPVHLGHLEMMIGARQALTAAGHEVSIDAKNHGRVPSVSDFVRW